MVYGKAQVQGHWIEERGWLIVAIEPWRMYLDGCNRLGMLNTAKLPNEETNITKDN